MNDFTIENLDHLPLEIANVISKGHIQDEAKAGIVCDYKQFSLVLKNSHQEILGALVAYTAFAEIYIDDIWVKPEYRGLGLGRQLLQTLEQLYSGQGYNNMNLVTSTFQAAEFYKKCGFEKEFVRVNTHNPKLTKFFFVKYFNDTLQSKGILSDV
jgi:ribosomal protein S18 acetylase RimI-like enzyme